MMEVIGNLEYLNYAVGKQSLLRKVKEILPTNKHCSCIACTDENHAKIRLHVLHHVILTRGKRGLKYMIAK
jgi:hypothetical protein